MAAKEVKRARGLKRRHDIELLLQNAMLEGTISKKEYVIILFQIILKIGKQSETVVREPRLD